MKANGWRRFGRALVVGIALGSTLLLPVRGDGEDCTSPEGCEGDVQIETHDISNSGNETQAQIQNAVELDPYGAMVPNWTQIGPLVAGWVIDLYQGFVSLVPTAYSDGILVWVDYSWGEDTYRDVYALINNGGSVQVILISRGNVI